MTRAGRGGAVSAPAPGYTYVGLLILVAVLATSSAAALHLGHAHQRRVAERELLDKGMELVRALESYSTALPGGQGAAPARIDDLLRDPRFEKQLVRHLRRIPVDPITGQPVWGEVRSPDGRRITGFHSLSTDRPVRTEDLGPGLEDFEGKTHYSEWVFVLGMDPS